MTPDVITDNPDILDESLRDSIIFFRRYNHTPAENLVLVLGTSC